MYVIEFIQLFMGLLPINILGLSIFVKNSQISNQFFKKITNRSSYRIVFVNVLTDFVLDFFVKKSLHLLLSITPGSSYVIELSNFEKRCILLIWYRKKLCGQFVYIRFLYVLLFLAFFFSFSSTLLPTGTITLLCIGPTNQSQSGQKICTIRDSNSCSS